MEDSLAKLELEKAFTIRECGNEGMARVLARRAAGLAIREYLSKKNFDQRGLSLNALINDDHVRQTLPKSIHEALDRLSTRISADFQFPENFDLLQDAQQVIDQLSLN